MNDPLEVLNSTSNIGGGLSFKTGQTEGWRHDSRRSHFKKLPALSKCALSKCSLALRSSDVCCGYGATLQRLNSKSSFLIVQCKNLRHPGIEPGPPAWKADVLTTTPVPCKQQVPIHINGTYCLYTSCNSLTNTVPHPAQKSGAPPYGARQPEGIPKCNDLLQLL